VVCYLLDSWDLDHALGSTASVTKRNLLRGARGEIDKERQLGQSKCHAARTYDTGLFVTTDTTVRGANMICHFPVKTNSTFPLISFAHGFGGGGFMIAMYTSMMQQLASSGFVVCAYTDCYPWCPGRWPKPQLDVISFARKLGEESGENKEFRRKMTMVPRKPHVPASPQDPADADIESPTLPINKESKAGVLGYSSGGICTLLSAYTDTAKEYSIGAVVTYDGDGAAYANRLYPNVNLDLENVASIPIFMAASTIKDRFGTPPECQEHARPNTAVLLEKDPNRSLLVACIDGMDHLDNINDIFRWQPPLMALRYVIAFFGYILDPSSECVGHYEDILGGQLKNASSEHYVNNLF